MAAWQSGGGTNDSAFHQYLQMLAQRSPGTGSANLVKPSMPPGRSGPGPVGQMSNMASGIGQKVGGKYVEQGIDKGISALKGALGGGKPPMPPSVGIDSMGVPGGAMTASEQALLGMGGGLSGAGGSAGSAGMAGLAELGPGLGMGVGALAPAAETGAMASGLGMGLGALAPEAAIGAGTAAGLGAGAGTAAGLGAAGAGAAGAGAAGGAASLAWLAPLLAMFSTKTLKKGISEPVDAEEAIEAIKATPVRKWKYTWDSDERPERVGPLLEESPEYWRNDQKTLDVVSINGSLLLAVQHLLERVEALEAQLNGDGK